MSNYRQQLPGSLLAVNTCAACIVAPTIATKGVSNETETGADSGGENITNGGGTISSKGIQWSEFSDFNTILGAKNEGTGTASFTSSMTSLASDNTYYVRAYAQNEVGIAYGQVESFQTALPPPGRSYLLLNGGQSDAYYSYTSPSGALVSSQLGGGEADVICARTDTVSADANISVNRGGAC